MASTNKPRFTKPYWLDLIRKHNAVFIASPKHAPAYPTQAIAFETQNFGWILSARDDNGRRTILEQF